MISSVFSKQSFDLCNNCIRNVFSASSVEWNLNGQSPWILVGVNAHFCPGSVVLGGHICTKIFFPRRRLDCLQNVKMIILKHLNIYDMKSSVHPHCQGFNFHFIFYYLPSMLLLFFFFIVLWGVEMFAPVVRLVYPKRWRPYLFTLQLSSFKFVKC